MLKKTRLVCTMGPACDNEETLRKMMENGMNVARFNFSHGSYEEHLGRYNRVVKVRDELKLPVATSSIQKVRRFVSVSLKAAR